jgi:hypothetical protein
VELIAIFSKEWLTNKLNHTQMCDETYEARTLLVLGVSDTDTTLTITLNYVIFPNYYPCRRVSVHVVSGVCVGVCAS